MLHAYYKNQHEVSQVLKYIIDSYWAKKLSEEEMISSLLYIYEKNKNKIIDGSNEIKSIIKQRCGKNRIEVFKNVLINERGEYTSE